MHPARRLLLCAFAAACAALPAASPLRAAEAGFSAGLSPSERAMAGISRLAPAQVAVLDALVGHDVTLAHEGGVTGFSSDFTARRTQKERIAAGIDRLSEGERSALDTLAARAIAYGPPPSAAFAYAPERGPVPQEVQVSAPLKPEVHGDVSMTVGGGSHGTSFYGASLDLFVIDPSGNFTIGVGVSEFRGKGLIGPLGPYCLLPGPILPGW